MSNAPLLVIDNLSKYFNTAAGQLHAVDGVSFTLEEGKNSRYRRRIRLR